MKVILMRHGQSHNNIKLHLPAEQYESSRDPDPDLSDVGRS
jgi:broad specificity phosphatase PhoE